MVTHHEDHNVVVSLFMMLLWLIELLSYCTITTTTTSTTSNSEIIHFCIGDWNWNSTLNQCVNIYGDHQHLKQQKFKDQSESSNDHVKQLLNGSNVYINNDENAFQSQQQKTNFTYISANYQHLTSNNLINNTTNSTFKNVENVKFSVVNIFIIIGVMVVFISAICIITHYARQYFIPQGHSTTYTGTGFGAHNTTTKKSNLLVQEYERKTIQTLQSLFTLKQFIINPPIVETQPPKLLRHSLQKLVEQQSMKNIEKININNNNQKN